MVYDKDAVAVPRIFKGNVGNTFENFEMETTCNNLSHWKESKNEFESFGFDTFNGSFYFEGSFTSIFSITTWDALRHLVPFVQFKKREKHPLISVAFSKVQ